MWSCVREPPFHLIVPQHVLFNTSLREKKKSIVFYFLFLGNDALSNSLLGSEVGPFIERAGRGDERACVYLWDLPDGNAWLCFCSLALSTVRVCK